MPRVDTDNVDAALSEAKSQDVVVESKNSFVETALGQLAGIKLTSTHRQKLPSHNHLYNHHHHHSLCSACSEMSEMICLGFHMMMNGYKHACSYTLLQCITLYNDIFHQCFEIAVWMTGCKEKSAHKTCFFDVNLYGH